MTSSSAKLNEYDHVEGPVLAVETAAMDEHAAGGTSIAEGDSCRCQADGAGVGDYL